MISFAKGKEALMALPTQIFERLSRLSIRPEDIDERFVRGAGPGGQKINKTSSTVWLRHGPSATEVRCQAERSQAANRQKAWEELCDKLEAQLRAKNAAVQQVREAERRRTRPKTRAQKLRMIETKKIRAKRKSRRSKIVGDD